MRNLEPWPGLPLWLALAAVAAIDLALLAILGASFCSACRLPA
ncbi:MAG TPA: hypothetical protein VHV26_16510 [Rhizomicrobium sp.]|jgi:hypothetical protein|nr:hypothetical protein [Rhizomicrobium sp.]